MRLDRAVTARGMGFSSGVRAVPAASARMEQVTVFEQPTFHARPRTWGCAGCTGSACAYALKAVACGSGHQRDALARRHFPSSHLLCGFIAHDESLPWTRPN